MTSIIPAYATTAILLALATPAFAQGAPDIQDAINRDTQVDEVLRDQQRQIPRPAEEGDDIIDGEAGVYLLTLNEIFYVGGSLGGGWSENPQRTDDDIGDSFFAQAAATAGLQTQLGGQIDAGLAVTLSGIEYDKDFAPSSRTFTSTANLGTRIAGTPLYIGATGFGGFAYDEDFENGSSFYGGYLALSAALPLDQRTIMRAAVQGGRQMGGAEENNNWSTNFSTSIAHLVHPRVSIGAEASVTRSWFDDFFEDVTFVERRDWEYGGNANVIWSPNNWLSVAASGGYQERNSTFFLSSYSSWEASLIISARKRF